MFLRCVLAALAAGAAFDVLASPVASLGKKRDVPATHVLHERHLPHWSRQWSKREKVDSSSLLPMRIGLRQSNLDAGHERLMDV